MYLKEFKHQIQVYINHKNLLYFMIIKVLNWKQIKWLKKLSLYNFQIQYQKEFKNLKINVLSKKVNHMINKSQINQTILQENLNDSIVYNKQNAVTLWINNRDLEKQVKLKLAKNSVMQDIIKNIENNVNFEIINEILTFQDLIYVSTKCKQKIINNHHKLIIHEHQNLNKSIEKIFKIYYFSKIRKQIENIIRKCNVYICIKHN